MDDNATLSTDNTDAAGGALPHSVDQREDCALQPNPESNTSSVNISSVNETAGGHKCLDKPVGTGSVDYLGARAMRLGITFLELDVNRKAHSVAWWRASYN